MKKQNRILLTVLPLIVLVCFSVWLVQTDIPSQTISSSTGEWDLQGFDFTDTAVRLSGDVQYIPGRIVLPEQFDADASIIRIGRPETESNVSTSRVRLLVPDGETYMLLIRTVDYADNIYVNGKWMAGAGVPSETPEHFEPGKRNVLFSAEPVNGVIEIVQQTANFVHKDSGYHTNVTVGRQSVVQNIYARLLGSTAIIAGSFLALLITHIALYILLRSYKVNLYAALFCLVWCLRTGITGIRLLPSMLPMVTWGFFFRAEYLSLPLGCVLIVLTLRGLFPNVFPRWFNQAMTAISGVYISVCLICDTMLMSVLLPYYQLILGAGILFVIIRFAWKLRRTTLEQRALVAGICFLLYAFAHEMLFYRYVFNSLNGSILNNSILSMALLVYIFFQTAVVIFSTVQEASDARLREKKLADENTALDRVNRMKTEFLGNISHELKTPLAVISSHAQLTRQHEQEGEARDDYVVNKMLLVSSEAERTAALVEQLLEITRIEEDRLTLNLCKANITGLVREMAETFYPVLNKNHNKLQINVPPDVGYALCDEQRVKQVLLNLISNSIRFTRYGTIRVSAKSEDGVIAVTVSDTGTGIEKAQIPLLFDRYYTKKPAGGAAATGTGLGLYISKRIIEEHGGTIHIESEINAGTTVMFTLPEAVWGVEENNHGE